MCRNDHDVKGKREARLIEHHLSAADSDRA